MRLAELSASTSVSVATLKYYLREGLLHPGEAVSRTQAEYDGSHVERVRLVRALQSVGGLSLATIGRVLAVLDSPGSDRLDVLAAAQKALAPTMTEAGSQGAGGRGSGGQLQGNRGAGGRGSGGRADTPSHNVDDLSAITDGAEGPGETAEADDGRAQRWVEAHGWQVAPGDPLYDQLDAAWAACDAAGIGLDEARMDAYADAVEEVARIDVGSVPTDPEGALRQVVLGTVLLDPVLATLRRMAHQHLSVAGAAPRER